MDDRLFMREVLRRPNTISIFGAVTRRRSTRQGPNFVILMPLVRRRWRLPGTFCGCDQGGLGCSGTHRDSGYIWAKKETVSVKDVLPPFLRNERR